MASSTEELSGMAQQLQGMVANFKLGEETAIAAEEPAERLSA